MLQTVVLLSPFSPGQREAMSRELDAGQAKGRPVLGVQFACLLIYTVICPPNTGAFWRGYIRPCSGIIPEFGRPLRGPEVEFGSGICKASTSLAVQFLWPSSPSADTRSCPEDVLVTAYLAYLEEPLVRKP